MSIFKHLNPVAIATVLYAAAPAIAATQSNDSSGTPDVKWWMQIVGQRPRVTDDVIEKIQPGINQADVKALIGPPQSTGYFPRSHTTAWDYQYRDVWGYRSTFSAIFDEDNVLVSKVSVRRPY